VERIVNEIAAAGGSEFLRGVPVDKVFVFRGWGEVLDVFLVGVEQLELEPSLVREREVPRHVERAAGF
jgi:hypothetical protein